MEQPQLLLPEGDANYSAIADYKDEMGFGQLGYTITAAVPEPETYAMLLAGLGLIGVAARRRAA